MRSERTTVDTLAKFPFLPDQTISPIQGGRKAAEQALAQVDPGKYTRTRNFLDGAVTRLSPYLRHGILTLAEVRDQALTSVRKREDAEKFVNELGWRDYWQRLYTHLGNAVWTDLEAGKTGFTAESYAPELPAELLTGSTGLHCMDSFSRQLRETGYLHNHARMWMAAYVVHWLRVRWQAGAHWFLQHLLDGDPASNNLSWQWVASTFSNKPYFFNRENLERYTNGIYCRECPHRQSCPFEGPYADLESKLFRTNEQPDALPSLQSLQERLDPTVPAATTLAKPLLWIHTDGLNPKSELFTRFPQASACFVWDESWLKEEKISSKRVHFLEECLAEMPPIVEQRTGDVASELLAAVEKAGADHIVALRTPDPRLLAARQSIERTVPITWIAPPSFVDTSHPYNLKRFSRYWQRAQTSAMRPTNNR